MVSISTLCRYLAHRLEYSVALSWKKYKVGQIRNDQVSDSMIKNLLQVKLTTYLHWKHGEEMAPTITGKEGTLLVRKLPYPEPTRVFVGDVVILKDPEKPDDYIVRRLAAVEGYEMVSKDDKDTPFVLEKDQCWVLADNESLSAKEAHDSRIFGPVPMTDIIGRVIYCLRNSIDHGPVQNRSGPLYGKSTCIPQNRTADALMVCHVPYSHCMLYFPYLLWQNNVCWLSLSNEMDGDGKDQQLES
ncbi:hypothetical protein AMTRI_Chr07g24110 [Amborella trichopoda]